MFRPATMADHTAFPIWFIIKPLISLYKRMFVPSTASPSSAIESQWAKWFYTFLHYLCFSPDQFNDAVVQTASYCDCQIEPKYESSFSSKQTFTTCPTVLLRAIVPSSGFTITFRAMIDTGACFSLIYNDLSTLLFDNGATCEYIWPVKVPFSFYEVQTMIYRKINGLILQSVEDTSVNLTITIPVDEYFKYMCEDLPVDMIVEKMASLGLPIVQTGKLGRTMWSKEEPNSQYCFDMLIGQDILNAHFNLHPFQPTYHISPSLAIIRTKMGLAFIGQFDTEKFKRWTLSTTEAKKLKKILYQNNTNKTDTFLAQKEEIDSILTFEVFDIRRNWEEYACAFLYAIIYVIGFSASILFCLFAFVFKCFICITFLHLLTVINSAYTNYLSFLFYLVINAKKYHQQFIIPILSQWLNNNSSIGPDLMPYSVRPRLAVTVKSDTCTKTVWAFIDTGSPVSVISTKLAEKLNVNPFEELLNDRNLEFVNIEIGKPNDIQFTKIKLMLTSIVFDSNPDQDEKMRSLFSKIAYLLDIPLFNLQEKDTVDVLIGTDLIPSLLFPSPSLPKRIIPLTANLNAVETRLGFYLQGAQFNYNIDFCKNWAYSLLPCYLDNCTSLALAFGAIGIVIFIVVLDNTACRIMFELLEFT